MRGIGRFVILGLVFVGCALPPAGVPPATARSPVTDTYHGTDVVDEYRWLEDWSDPEVRAWSEAQNAYARRILDRLPAFDRVRERVAGILQAESVSHVGLNWTAGRLFAIKSQPPKEQAFLVVMGSFDDPESARTIVDPNALDAEGGTSIDWYKPSPDGKLVAVSMSRGGSESGDLHLLDVETGQPIEDPIPRVNGGTAGGDVTWTRDGSGLFYTRYPRPGERPEEEQAFFQQVWFHRLGRPQDSDRYEIGEGKPRVAEFRLESDPASDRILVTMQDGDSGRFEHHLREPDGTWKQVTRFEDRVVQAGFAPDGSLIMISRRDAPRGKILRAPGSDLSLSAAKTLVAEGSDTLMNDFYGSSPIVATESRIYATYQLGGPSTIRVFDLAGTPQAAPEVLPVSSVGQIVRLEGDAILFRNGSFLQPWAWYLYDDGETRRSAMFMASPVDFSDTEVVRETATSKDGTQVPVNILRRKGIALDGSHPTLLTGYGGFGISIEPRFSATRRVWIEQGGVFAVANLRGGSEFGEEWHRAGMLTDKQNVFDDFIAAMQHLIDAGYTSSERLAIRGGSNGGLLMGAVLTQRPGLCRAVASAVGIYDMLRVELSSNGAFNIPEYGTVENPDHFRAMYAYSPYHNVRDGTAYPAVLFTTGANDPRVDPMQSRKMTARLQAAGGSDRPILLRTSGKTGHGGSTPLSEQVEELAHHYAFLFNELAVAYAPAAPAGR